MKTTDKIVIVFSGFNQRAVIAFLRSMRSSGVRYAVIAKSVSDTIFSTDFAGDVIATRASVQLELDDLLMMVRKAYSALGAADCIIAPTAEALNRFLLDHRTEFEQAGCTIPLVDAELYSLVSDKYRFGELCRQHGIAVPGEYPAVDASILPCVAKPINYFSASHGRPLVPYILGSARELEGFLAAEISSDFYYQQFISGDSFYLLYYFHRNGTVLRYSQKNLVQQPEGKSIVLAVSSTVHTEPVAEAFERMFRSIGFHGLIMVEFKREQGKDYMIEANPRFWGPSQLFVDAGIDFFRAFLHDNGAAPSMPMVMEPSATVRYCWFGGIVDAWRSGKPLAFHDAVLNSDGPLMEQLPEFLAADVHRRTDTQQLFINEVKGS